jgi:putative transposase
VDRLRARNDRLIVAHSTSCYPRQTTWQCPLPLQLLLNSWCWLIKVLQVKYLNNIIEQDHRFIKRITRQMKGFKSFASAQATLAGIETAHMIRKGQLAGRGQSAFQQFKALAG